METPPLPPAPAQKKGLGPLAWIGIGCGGIIVLCIIGAIAVYFVFAPSVKQFVTDAQKDPTHATANLMVNASRGKLEMAAEDEANKRYTVRDKSSGKLITVYWNEKKKMTETIDGDFSAIPVTPSAPDAPEALPLPSATPEPPPAPETK